MSQAGNESLHVRRTIGNENLNRCEHCPTAGPVVVSRFFSFTRRFPQVSCLILPLSFCFPLVCRSKPLFIQTLVQALTMGWQFKRDSEAAPAPLPAPVAEVQK